MRTLIGVALVAAAGAGVAVALRSVSASQVSSAQDSSAIAGDSLRVCADPNNLPYSNAQGAGFENKIAEMIGASLHRPVGYVWWAQRRGFVRNTLNAGMCDLVVGTVAGMDMLATTRPYYRSSYVFVSRRDRRLNVRSFDDPRLRTLRIAIQLIGDDGVNTPPAHALANRGITKNLVGFTVYGDYRKPNPTEAIVDAVVNREADVAVVWGPLAGYYARRLAVPLDLVPVWPRIDVPYLPFVFDIAMGARRRDTTFRAQLDDFIVARHQSIDSILDAYGVPRVEASGSSNLIVGASR
ncbi:MAG TPA: quinoprotein dehydrogenase-associated putative ABC transporter substrate-binding protein [Gemmatimonadaceae bacterium]|jgi:mxaJ protein|nr:quinoprotein dehydrogenase-associated putative ABC transporter substrate-binding protein [Gemmatimonadaceae bacterium]